MKKIVLSFLCIMMLCGCSSYKEINNGYLVTGVAFETVDENVKIYANVLTAQDDKSIILSAVGENLDSSFNELKKSQVKRLYFEHCGTVALNTNLEKEIVEILKFCKTEIKLPIAATVVYCNNVTALFAADRTGYDVITLLKNNKSNKGDRIYEIEQNSGEMLLPFVSVNEGVISFEGKVK